MKFSSREDRINWLRLAGQKIQAMERERLQCIMSGDFGQAFSLLKGIKFARDEFKKVSWALRRSK